MIEDTFLKLKSNLELTSTFSDAISTRHNAVRSVIENNGLSVKDTRLIGSVGRRTRIQPRAGDEFDIDILVILGEFHNWVAKGITTDMAMGDVLGAMQKTDRYSKMRPEQDHPTVTFSYANDVAIELVPAYRDLVGRSPNGGPTHSPSGRAYWVPARAGKWELADYDYEAEQITKVNQESGGLLIPAVKMLKAAKREHFPSLKSYHLEVIATHVIPIIIAEYRAKGEAVTFPMIVGAFLWFLDRRLGQTWSIPGSLSPACIIAPIAEAEILAKIDWLRHQLQTAMFGKTDGDKHRAWKPIFGEVLPLP